MMALNFTYSADNPKHVAVPAAYIFVTMISSRVIYFGGAANVFINKATKMPHGMR